MEDNQRRSLEALAKEAGKKDDPISNGKFPIVSRLFSLLGFGSKGENSKPKTLSADQTIALINKALPTTPSVQLTLVGKNNSVQFEGKLAEVQIDSPLTLIALKGKTVSQPVTSVEYNPPNIVITTKDGKKFILATAQFKI